VCAALLRSEREAVSAVLWRPFNQYGFGLAEQMQKTLEKCFLSGRGFSVCSTAGVRCDVKSSPWLETPQDWEKLLMKSVNLYLRLAEVII